MIHIEKLEKINTQIEDLQKEKGAIKRAILEEISPYKVGDIIESKGYSYNGKKCKIAALTLTERNCGGKVEYDIKVLAALIKKDGTEGRDTAWGSWNDPLLENALIKLKEAK